MKLTPRETEVVRLLLKGHSSKRIAFDLGLSVNTIGNTRQRIKEKTGASKPLELLAWAVANDFDLDKPVERKLTERELQWWRASLEMIACGAERKRFFL